MDRNSKEKRASSPVNSFGHGKVLLFMEVFGDHKGCQPSAFENLGLNSYDSFGKVDSKMDFMVEGKTLLQHKPQRKVVGLTASVFTC